jgi:hypothetical protein
MLYGCEGICFETEGASENGALKIAFGNWAWWFTPVILATWEAVNGRMAVGS